MPDRTLQILFTLIYITIGQLVIGGIWLYTSGRRYYARGRGGYMTLLIQIISHIIYIASGIISPLPLSREMDTLVRALGLTIYTVGMCLAIWAKYSIGESWGIPGQHDVSRQQSLMTHGAYGYSRHPIYVGIILMSLGIAVTMRSPYVFAVFVLYHHLTVQIRTEERLLLRHFGAQYRRYMARVPRWI